MRNSVGIVTGFIIYDEPEEGSDIVVLYCEDGALRVLRGQLQIPDQPEHGLTPEAAAESGMSPGSAQPGE